MPVIIKVNDTRYAISPTDWKNRSDTKLPWKPNIFLISVLSGKIKLGSSGEYVVNAINNKNPEEKIIIPNISVNLLIAKRSNKLAVFLIFINHTNESI